MDEEGNGKFMKSGYSIGYSSEPAQAGFVAAGQRAAIFSRQAPFASASGIPQDCQF
jgi:hypothetical protein